MLMFMSSPVGMVLGRVTVGLGLGGIVGPSSIGMGSLWIACETLGKREVGI